MSIEVQRSYTYKSLHQQMRVKYRFMNRVLCTRAAMVWRVALVALLLNASASRASWQIVFSNSDGSGFRSCFFFNESTGFIAGTVSDGIFKTTNGGQTWTNTPLPFYPSNPLAPDNKAGFVTQIRMIDELHGWLTCELDRYDSFPVYPGLYKTTDGGASWNFVANVKENFSDVYQTPRALVLCSRDIDAGGTGYISLDNGLTFSPEIPITNGVDFVDNLHGVATGFINHPWSYSANGGITWASLPAAAIESWSVYGVKGTPWFFTAPEQDPNPAILPSPILFSSDFGSSWSTKTVLPFRTNGHVAGFGFTLYVQNWNGTQTFGGKTNPPSGIWRSKDSGKTWVSIGGPANTNDTRFFVTGCRGEVIYAFDAQGNVWKTSDGGDGSLPQFSPPPALVAVDSIDACTPRDTTISIPVLGCDTVLILNASAPAVPSLDILDPATGNKPNFPIIIPADSTGNLKLELRSSVLGAYQTKVFLEFERAGFITFDTVTIKSALKFYNPIHLLSSIRYDSTALCGSIDSVLTITNDSCFDVQLVSTQFKYGTSFAFDSTYANELNSGKLS